MNEPEHRKAPIPDLERFVRDVLIAAGVAAEEATLVAAEVVDAEARGYESQGLMRVTPYVKAAQSGDTRSPTSLEPIRDAPSAFAWDAGFGWGHVAASRAMAECAARARRTGSCVATIRNIGHIGRLGYYVEQAAALGVVGFISCCGNASSAVVAPWGGKEARLSTNPFAYGFPHPGGDPVVVDISTSQAARGKVLVAAATGRSIPDDWAFDSDGAVTTDPTKALPPDGTLQPVGGHKGYALSIVVEMLCGVLGGPYPPAESTVFVAAYDVEQLTSPEEYAHAVEKMDRLMQSSALRPGFDSIRLPGQGSGERRRTAEREGVTLTPAIWDAVCATARSVGIEPPTGLA